MNKVKVRWITIAALIALFALVFGFAFGSLAAVRKDAAAIDYAPNRIFSASSSGTSVDASEAASEGDPSFIQFTMVDNGTVQFRRDLALKWYERASDDQTADSRLANPGAEKYFNMTFSFPSVVFDAFTISFESDEENISKEGKSVNAVIFESGADGALSVKIRNADEQDAEDADLTVYAMEGYEVSDNISVTFAAGQGAGEYAVIIAYGETGTETVVSGDEDDLKFTNIGGNYIEYRSSASSAPNMPITFTAELPDDEEDDQLVHMKSLNGQSFELREDGRLEDTVAPVLVLNESLYAFTLGRRFSLTYEAIDVCDDTVQVEREYYMLKTDENGNYVTPESGDYKTLTTSTYFAPTSDDGDEREFVSIRFRLDDGRTRDDAQRDAEDVYLTWYAADPSIVETFSDAGGNGLDYVLVDREKEGPYYIGLGQQAEDGSENVFSDRGAYDAAVEAYQQAVTEAAEGLSAGSGSYIYLPSLRGLIASDYAGYRNLRFSIYYYKQSQTADSSASSETALNYNGLRFEVDEKGQYKFRVLATDVAGNAMMLYEDGELVEVTGSNIWEIDAIPEFTFTVGYTGATVEDPGSQEYGYRDRSYSISSFDIVALEGYVTDYTLYYFDTSSLEQSVSYSECVEKAEEFVTSTYADKMHEIRVFNSEISEDDDMWDDTDNAYYWDPDSSLSFTPVRSGIYFVELIVTDPNHPGVPVRAYQAIEVRNPVDIIPGETQWLQNNVTSIVLFSVSAVLAVIIIVLLVVKPSDKSVEQVDLSKLKGKKKRS